MAFLAMNRILRCHVFSQNQCVVFHHMLSSKKSDFACNQPIIDFKNSKGAFNNKTTWKLFRSYIILRLCAVDFLSRNSLMVMSIAQKVMGKQIFERCMKFTIYGQFVAGDDERSVKMTVNELHNSGVRVIVSCTSENDVGDVKNRTQYYDECTSHIIQCIHMAQLAEPKHPMVQMKMTGIISPDIIVKLSKVENVKKISLQEIIYNQLSGNDTVITTHENVIANSILNESERQTLHQAVANLRRIGKVALTEGVILLIDAEYTYMNPGINIFALAMMRAFNRERPVVWNTYQCYLKNTFDRIKMDVELIHRFGVCFGAKLVRGAYLHQERELAIINGYPDPLNISFQATSLMYHKVTDYMLQYIYDNPEKCRIIMGTHNEDTVEHVIQRMQHMGFTKNDPSICFGQILGMSDHISFLLSKNGYNVYKSSPFGKVESVLPYLYRRAMENQAVIQGSRNEVNLLWLELKNRVKEIFVS